jgi:integrase
MQANRRCRQAGKIPPSCPVAGRTKRGRLSQVVLPPVSPRRKSRTGRRIRFRTRRRISIRIECRINGPYRVARLGTTKAAYTAALRPVVELLGDRTVQSITKSDIKDVVQALQRGTTDRGVWASTSINPMLARLRAVFGDLQNQGIVACNVPPLVKAVRPADNRPRPSMKTLSVERIEQLVEYHRHKHDELLVHFALLGLCRGELAGLRWSDIDLGAGTITVQRARVTDGRTAQEGDTKTQAGRRELPIPDRGLAGRTCVISCHLAGGGEW